MSAGRLFNRYYLRVESFIAIIHEIEQYPALPHFVTTIGVQTIPQADVDRWVRFFDVTEDEARFFIIRWRYGDSRLSRYSAKVLKAWP